MFLNNNDSNLIITFHNNYDPLQKNYHVCYYDRIDSGLPTLKPVKPELRRELWTRCDSYRCFVIRMIRSLDQLSIRSRDHQINYQSDNHDNQIIISIINQIIISIINYIIFVHGGASLNTLIYPDNQFQVDFYKSCLLNYHLPQLSRSPASLQLLQRNQNHTG